MVVTFHILYISALDGEVTLGCNHLTPSSNQQRELGEKPQYQQRPHIMILLLLGSELYLFSPQSFGNYSVMAHVITAV